MAQAQIFTGSWEQLSAYVEVFRNRSNLTLIVPTEAAELDAPAPQHFYITATHKEFRRAFNALGKENEKLPGLPHEAFDRENLYDEDSY